MNAAVLQADFPQQAISKYSLLSGVPTCFQSGLILDTLTTAIVLLFLGLCYFQPFLSFFRTASSCGSYQYPELLHHIFTSGSVLWAAGSFLLYCTRMTGLI